ncbi:MAG: hypothetical protein U0168_01655 [Nannocystaceae bacterium]
MQRPALGVVLALALAGVGCALLTPYPGGGDPVKAISDSTAGKGDSPFDTGDPQEPLFDPAIDDSVHVVTNVNDVVAIPGSSFVIDLAFVADNANVVGGGIQFPGSSEVQWTFIDGLEGMSSGDIRFGYVVDKNVCNDIPNLCHEIKTTQFAVARNAGGGDVDGDGSKDGEFVVSPGEEVTVVLQCATCDSPSCRDLLPDGECFFCAQPDVCKEYFDRCLAEGKPNASDESEVQLFDTLFGIDGILWSTRDGCVVGEGACTEAQKNAETMPDECGL